MGDCGSRSYNNITPEKIDKILSSMKNGGSSVSGDNPWTIDTHIQGIKLRGRWDKSTSELVVEITDSPGYLPCTVIWNKIEELMRSI